MKDPHRGESSSFMIIMLVSGLKIPYICKGDFSIQPYENNGIFTELCRLGMDCSEFSPIFLTC